MGINEGAEFYFWIDVMQDQADEIIRTWVLEIAEISERTLDFCRLELETYTHFTEQPMG